MKKQPSKIENGYTSVVSYLVALPLCILIWISMKIVWPILRFFAKFAWKQFRNVLTPAKVVKPATSKLPTPEIFKGAPNLARAKSVRF